MVGATRPKNDETDKTISVKCKHQITAPNNCHFWYYCTYI